ncbi:hypothetical protein P5673_026442 [Acropora cervicornis]|uniref:Uncharacterized protein n=1 Tax=Acropora cervicornis TaxID=6130 RepID=A0AAD9UWC4_ACRCE|nr:hypothetical protein P5673_026442 [Acropora cervicornis]
MLTNFLENDSSLPIILQGAPSELKTGRRKFPSTCLEHPVGEPPSQESGKLAQNLCVEMNKPNNTFSDIERQKGPNMEKSRLELTDVDHKPKLFLLENLCNVSNVLLFFDQWSITELGGVLLLRVEEGETDNGPNKIQF